ncbi:MAG: bifunctional oligoribonuclease/PAP phosphatase NrnA [Anaerolineaceae bacterium]|jgi:phosphoesterase RecJ-like protein|nr:bifunctional oligoribonuclease/PAP phosphatase NrnA [Anaerolineaceae bacterium]
MTKKINQDIKDRIAGSDRILVVSHVRPDADAVGSVLGLGLALRAAGKTVQMVLEDGSDNFEYLPQYDTISRQPEGQFDMVIVVDCSDPDRVGHVLDDYGKPTLVVDHHKTNLQFGEYNVVEPDQAATAAILYDAIPTWGLSFTPEVATSLLSGIVGDTIGFRTSNVDSQLLRRAAALMDLGADLANIYREELVLKSFTEARYWGAGLNRLELEDGLVWASLTLADREKIGYAGNDDADLVNVLSSVREAEIALIFIEQPQNQVKVSWRARPGYDVSGLAFSFGGGGHAAAAGADIDGSLNEVIQRVIIETKAYLQNIN